VSRPHILLVERSRAQGSSTFADALKKRYDLTTASSGKQALELEQIPFAIVLDAISMRTPGERIAKQLKSELPTTPLIHLHPGSKDDASTPADIVLFLPFTARKLINSIERLSQPATGETVISYGPISMNVTRRLLIANGQETPLTPKLARLVEIFMQHPGETLDRKQLMEYVWQTNYLGDTRTLDVHIRWIRRAIEIDPGNPRYLKTVRGVGYRLDVADTEVVAESSGLVLQKL
jgi:DNA-binding response OmpR family regulator